MKKALLTVLMVVCLSGCSSNNARIKCEEISVREGEKVEHYYHPFNELFDHVIEYVSEAGDVIYTDYAPGDYHVAFPQDEPIYYPIKVYATKESTEYVEYAHSRIVGMIGYAENYYLDLRTKTVETERLYNKTALSYPDESAFWDAKEAYECAQKNYYHYDGDDAVYLDETPKGLECHFFDAYGEKAEITYVEIE